VPSCRGLLRDAAAGCGLEGVAGARCGRLRGGGRAIRGAAAAVRRAV